MEIIPSDNASATILTWLRLAGVIRDAAIHKISSLSPIELPWQTVILHLEKLYLLAVELDVLQTALEMAPPELSTAGVWVSPNEHLRASSQGLCWQLPQLHKRV